MPSDGDMYVFSDHIRVDVNSGRIVNEDGWDFVQGCQPHAREPHMLAVQWVAPMLMAQLAPGHKWCSTCGDVRPFSYFDPLTVDAEGRVTAYAQECKQCINGRDPKLRPTKYCSGCKNEKRRNDFSLDERNCDGLQDRCKACDAERKRVEYREIVGRPVRKYERQEATA